MNKILILPLIFCIFVITGCCKTELSEKQIIECRQVIENYFEDRSENLSNGDYYRYLSMDIIKKYCREKVDGDIARAAARDLRTEVSVQPLVQRALRLRRLQLVQIQQHRFLVDQRDRKSVV